MRHNRDTRKLGRNAGHLRCLLSNMTSDFILKGRIKTTLPKAKEVRRCAERMITLGKDGSLHARRRAMAFMRSKDAVKALFTDVAPRYSERGGGYTRIMKLGPRVGDAAPMGILELVEGEAPAAGVEKKAKPEKKPEKKPDAKKAKPEKKVEAKKAVSAKKEKPVKKAAAKKTDARKKAVSTKKASTKKAAKKDK